MERVKMICIDGKAYPTQGFAQLYCIIPDGRMLYYNKDDGFYFLIDGVKQKPIPRLLNRLSIE